MGSWIGANKLAFCSGQSVQTLFSKYTKEIYNVQGSLHFPNMLTTMVHGIDFYRALNLSSTNWDHTGKVWGQPGWKLPSVSLIHSVYQNRSTINFASTTKLYTKHLQICHLFISFVVLRFCMCAIHCTICTYHTYFIRNILHSGNTWVGNWYT